MSETHSYIKTPNGCAEEVDSYFIRALTYLITEFSVGTIRNGTVNGLLFASNM